MHVTVLITEIIFSYPNYLIILIWHSNTGSTNSLFGVGLTVCSANGRQGECFWNLTEKGLYSDFFYFTLSFGDTSEAKIHISLNWLFWGSRQDHLK